MPFNPHNNVTADGTVISVGLRVRTNDWTIGVVVGDRDSNCCGHAIHNQPDGQFQSGSYWFSDHVEANKMVAEGCYCRHDHWFEVKTETGSVRQYNGERLGTGV